MDFTFYKYHGTGNDFIIIDNRTLFFPKDNSKLIKKMCDRHFGIGADGLILLEYGKENGLYMHYFNANGKIGSMCGNGGRCFVHFTKFLGLTNDELSFNATDGEHEATLLSNGFISLKMNDVSKIDKQADHLFLDTGSPHHVQYVDDLKNFDVEGIGKDIRYRIYDKEGSNVNFVEKLEDDLFYVRTYERGVEDETFSCGTGVTAVALASYESKRTDSTIIRLKTHGGELEERFAKEENKYINIHLIGPASMVYKGEWKI
jgi:diaminopimelate epimerase